MSHPLTPPEKQSVEQAIAFLKKLMDCYEGIVGPLPATASSIQEIREAADELKTMLDNGLIDVETARPSIKAETDGDGIHINDACDSFSMPGDLHTEDCQEGYFASLWTLIEILIHERYHYHHHTGFFGRVLRRVPDTFFGGAVLMLNSLFGEQQRTWKWHEFKAYSHTYARLIFLEGAVRLVCSNNPDCIGCCNQHPHESNQAKERENPHSTFGN